MNFHELSNIIRFKKIQENSNFQIWRKFKNFSSSQKINLFYEFGIVKNFRVLEFRSVWQMTMRFESVSSQSIRKGITVEGRTCSRTHFKLEYQLDNSYITKPQSPQHKYKVTSENLLTFSYSFPDILILSHFSDIFVRTFLVILMTLTYPYSDMLVLAQFFEILVLGNFSDILYPFSNIPVFWHFLTYFLTFWWWVVFWHFRTESFFWRAKKWVRGWQSRTREREKSGI